MTKVFAALAICCVAACMAHGAADRKSFFPRGIWGPSTGTWTATEKDAFYENWFGDQLFAMNEPSLAFPKQVEAETLTVRLLFPPSFDRPAMMRLTVRNGEGATYVFKQLSGAGGMRRGNCVGRPKAISMPIFGLGSWH